MESGSFVLMSNLYAEKGDWEMVAKVGKWKRDEGVRKELIRDEDFEREHVGDKITENGLLLKALTLKA
ncbi:unnamed protein product [Prunus armeniaca]